MELETIIKVLDEKREELSKDFAGASITSHAMIMAQHQLIDELKKIFTRKAEKK